MQTVQYETLKTRIEDRVLIITLSRENRLNAFNEQMMNELIQVFDEADANDEVRAIIVTGEGKAFCAGADLGKGESTFETDVPDEEYRDGGGRVSLRIFDLKKPIIAAINGAAVGVGITMTLPMDVRIASTNARVGFVFSRRGITPEACSGWFLPRAVGISRAAELVYTGRILNAQEALEYGLVSRVVQPEELMDTAMALAKEIAENTSAISVALGRQLLWKMLGADHPMESHLIESKMIKWTGKQADVREGVSSFLEKRKPNFTMKVSTDMPDFFPWWEKRE